MQPLGEQQLTALAAAARDTARIQGLTHTFYRYPARFSPRFAATAIDLFSKPGDLVLDPFMGGGTTIIEAMSKGRLAVGSDLNELAVFIAGVKVTPLSDVQLAGALKWIADTVPRMTLKAAAPSLAEVPEDNRTRNLSLPRARPIRKALSIALHAVRSLRSPNQQNFVKCALLRAAQWALNGRKSAPTLSEFRVKVVNSAAEMARGVAELRDQTSVCASNASTPVLINAAASTLESHAPFACGRKADLVVTSPPYPGIHILYHRWQVDGRKETPAPYWIAGCNDGMGASYYNFAARRGSGLDRYYEEAQRNFAAVRRVMRSGALLVQMVAFGEPSSMLPRYLEMMVRAGFAEVAGGATQNADGRIWRSVPHRQWHANAKGETGSSSEVVLLHSAAS